MRVKPKLTSFLVLTLVLLAASLTNCGSSESPVVEQVEIDTTPPPPPPRMEFGFYVDSFLVFDDTTKKNQVISDILLPHHIGWGDMAQLKENSGDVFNIDRDIRPGRRYMVLCAQDSTEKAQYLIYEKNAIDYIVCVFGDSTYAYLESRPLEVRVAEASGHIKQGSSLWMTMRSTQENADIVNSLVDEVSDAYAWTIDFFNIKAGDVFKIIYDQHWVEGKLVGRGKVHGLYFYHDGVEFYGIKFTQDGSESYFDEKGKGLKKAFLKAPLKYSRISSPYSKKRFHPVQKRYKAHLGTDYAAPTGTPIWAVGDGTVIKKGFTKGNGNYVKIKHNDTYSTQYLHMSKFADGVNKGTFVKQGQVIGYVGSTGLATGPHVCFRFWKNGKQVDHRKEKFQSSDPIKEINKTAFDSVKNEMKARLDSIQVVVPIEEPS